MLTIAPPRAAITGTAYLEARNAVRRLTAKAWSQASSVVSTTVPSEASPMLFARMSTVPKASTATWIPDRHGRRLGRGRGHAGRALRPGGRRRRAVRDHQPARRRAAAAQRGVRAGRRGGAAGFRARDGVAPA